MQHKNEACIQVLMKLFTKVHGNKSKFVKNIKCLHVKDELPKVKCKLVAPSNNEKENAKLKGNCNKL